MDQTNGTDFGYFTLSQCTVREIPQPVKISQLFKSSGRPRDGRGNSASTISLPERITPYLKNISSKKKNVKNVCTKLSHRERNVRRNLNFTKTSTTSVKIKKLAKEHRNNLNNNSKEKTLCLSTRRSFLLPPNTIKDLYVKKGKQSRSVLPQSFTLTVDSKNKYSRISEELESCLSPVENKNACVDSVVHEKSKKVSVIQRILPETFNVNDQSGINILHSPLDLINTNDKIGERISQNLNSDEMSDIYSQNNGYNATNNRPELSSAYKMNMAIHTDVHKSNDIDKNNPCYTQRYSLATSVLSCTEKIKGASSVNVKKKKCPSTTTNNCRDLHPSLLPIIKSDDLQRNVNEEDEYISLSKTELIALILKLKRLTCKLDEDLSNMKLTLTTIMNTLSAISVTNKEIDNETEIQQQMIENLNNNTEIIRSINIKSPLSAMIGDAINTEDNNVTKETYKTSDINLSKFLRADLTIKNTSAIQSSCKIELPSTSNKESEILNTPNNINQCEKSKYETRRRSTRLMAKALNNLIATNDSFVDLENKLDIVNVKSNTTIASFKNCTPTTNECKDKKVGKPLKEYMALKSRLSCLLTPNIKRFNSLKSENNTRPEDKPEDTKTLSDKVLADLYNLYEDSVDTE